MLVIIFPPDTASSFCLFRPLILPPSPASSQTHLLLVPLFFLLLFFTLFLSCFLCPSLSWLHSFTPFPNSLFSTHLFLLRSILTSYLPFSSSYTFLFLTSSYCAHTFLSLLLSPRIHSPSAPLLTLPPYSSFHTPSSSSSVLSLPPPSPPPGYEHRVTLFSIRRPTRVYSPR